MCSLLKGHRAALATVDVSVPATPCVSAYPPSHRAQCRTELRGARSVWCAPFPCSPPLPEVPPPHCAHTADVAFDSSGRPLQRMATSHVACLPSVALVEPYGGCDAPRTPHTLTGVRVDPCVSVCYNASAGYGDAAAPEVLFSRVLQVWRVPPWACGGCRPAACPAVAWGQWLCRGECEL